MHSPEEPHVHDPDGKTLQVVAAAISAPAALVKLCTTDVVADCLTSFIQSETLRPRADVEEKVDAAQTVHTACGRVLRLRPADETTVNAPQTFTCGTKHVQTSLESTTFHPSGFTVCTPNDSLGGKNQPRLDSGENEAGVS